MCRTGCPTQDHENWGECARAARIQIDRHGLSGWGQLDKRKEHTLTRYRTLREQGAQPSSTSKTAVDLAEKASHETGTPFRADIGGPNAFGG